MRERTLLVNKLDPIDKTLTDIANVFELIELAESEGDAEMERELESEYEGIAKRFEEIETVNLFSEEFDTNNAYLTINAGAGGTESCDWTEMLLRMYLRFAERKGFSTEIVDEMPGEEAGIKQVQLYVKGDYAYGFFRPEMGVHRLVRISPFDSNARRHTSFAAVSVMPEVENDIEIEINQQDLRIDTFRASGAGGQHVNKTSSAIRITHIPTNIVVQCQAERSQHQNKDRAMSMLKAKLYQIEKEKQNEEKQKIAGEKTEMGWGNQIRSYVFHPYNLVKDLRTSHETGNTQAVMDGDIEPFVISYLRYRLKS